MPQVMQIGEENMAGYGKRASHGSLDAEDKVRLLINPCIDHPEKHFEYEKEYEIKILF